MTATAFPYLTTLVLLPAVGAGVVALILLTTWGGTTYTWGSTMILARGIGGEMLLIHNLGLS